MSILSWFEQGILASVDKYYALRPQALPQREHIKRCQIIAHRGVHDNQSIFENTLPAFDLAVQHGVWGIELDVRWTADLHPVVFHDQDGLRLFGSSLQIRQLSLAQLKTSFPLIPTLMEVIERYGKRSHLMLEIKKEIYPDPVAQNKTLQNLFAGLESSQDYHLISLHPEMFQLFNFVPAQALLPVAEKNVQQLSALALEQHYGGLTGHYLLLHDQLLQTHQNANQHLGTGFIASERCLFREINRGIKWIFSNDALKLQKICNDF